MLRLLIINLSINNTYIFNLCQLLYFLIFFLEQEKSTVLKNISANSIQLNRYSIQTMQSKHFTYLIYPIKISNKILYFSPRKRRNLKVMDIFQDKKMKLLDQMPGYVCIKNQSSRLVYLNQDFSKLAGFNCPEDFLSIGGLDEQMQCPAANYANTFRKEDRCIIKQGKTLKILGFYGYSGDDWRIMYTVKKPFYDAATSTTGVLCHAYDMTHSEIINLSPLIKELESHKLSKKNYSYYIGEGLKNHSLSDKQQLCLFYYIRGYTAKSVGEKIGLSKRTIESYLDTIKYKLQVNSKNELIEKAINNGFLSILPSSILHR